MDFISKILNIKSDISDNIFKIWRNRILTLLSILLASSVVYYLLLMHFNNLASYDVLRVAVYFIIIIFTIAQFFIKSLEYKTKAYIIMIFMAIHAYLLLIGYTDNLKNEVWFFSLPIMAALLLDYKAAIVGILINISHLLIVVEAASPHHPNLLHHSQEDWLMYKISQIGFNIFITFTILVLMSVLETIVRRLRDTSDNLITEKIKIEESNERLTNEIEERETLEQSLRQKELMLLKVQKMNHFSEFEVNLAEGFYKLSDDISYCFGVEHVFGKITEIESLTSAIYSGDLPMLESAYGKLIRGEESRCDELFRIECRKDGKPMWLRLKAEIVEYEDQKPKLIYGTVQDITHEKMQEFENRKRDIMYEKLFNTANDAIFIMKGNMFIDCNLKTLAIYDVERDDIIGKYPWEFSPEYQPDGQLSIDKAKKYIDAAYDGTPQFFYWKHTTAKKTEFDAEVALNCTEIDNEKFLQAIVRDVTRRMKSENELAASEIRLKLALEATRDAIWELDLTTRRLEAPPEFFEMLGFQQPKDTAFDLWLDNVHPDDKNLLYDFLTSPRSISPENRFSLEYRFMHSSGDWKWLATRGKVVKFAEDGTPLQIVGTNRDITKRKSDEERIKYINRELEVRVQKRTEQLEKALENLQQENNMRKLAQEELFHAKENLSTALRKEKELNELKSRFISMVSHEYRTPLTVILSSTYLLDAFFTKQKKDDFDKNLRQIQNSVRYMTKLLDEVLFVGKGETAILRLRKDSVNLKKFIPDLIEEVKYVALPGQIFTTNFPDDSVYYLGDENAVRYIIINLLSNASKYSPLNGVIKTDLKFDEEKKLITITISDSGKGIPDEDKEHIFSPLHRGKNVGSVPGTGLGLAIVHQYVTALLGTINFESDENKGTTFHVVLPQDPKI